MSNKPLQLAVLILAVSNCAGCTDKDREMARRKSDGTETFKFVVPTDDNPTGLRPKKPEKQEQPRVPAKPSALTAARGDGTDTFVFKVPPRQVPETNAPARK